MTVVVWFVGLICPACFLAGMMFAAWRQLKLEKEWAAEDEEFEQPYLIVMEGDRT